LRMPHAEGRTDADFAFSTQVSRQLVTDLLAGKIGSQQAALALCRSYADQPGRGPAGGGRASL